MPSCIERCKIKYRWGYKKGMRTETVGYESNREGVDEMDRVERVYIRKEKSIRQALKSSYHRNSQAHKHIQHLKSNFSTSRLSAYGARYRTIGLFPLPARPSPLSVRELKRKSSL